MNFAEVAGGVCLVSREGPLRGERPQGNLEEQREFARSDKSVGSFAGRRKANAKA